MELERLGRLTNGTGLFFWRVSDVIENSSAFRPKSESAALSTEGFFYSAVIPPLSHLSIFTFSMAQISSDQPNSAGIPSFQICCIRKTKWLPPYMQEVIF